MAPLHHQPPPTDQISMVSSTSLTMISKHSSSATGVPSIAGYACPIIDSTHSDSESSSLTVLVVFSARSDNTKYRNKKTSHKPCKYKYPRTIVEGKKLIIRGKTPLVQSGKEIYEKLKKKALCKKQAEDREKTNDDVNN
eukprot:scaffold192494_cov37-Attheya_sp.AAC.1